MRIWTWHQHKSVLVSVILSITIHYHINFLLFFIFAFIFAHFSVLWKFTATWNLSLEICHVDDDFCLIEFIYDNCQTDVSVTENLKKNAFQWDAYRPLIDHIPACTVAGGGYPPGGCTCPGGVPSKGVYLPGGRVPAQVLPPMWTEWLTDRCKNITFSNFVCGR